MATAILASGTASSTELLTNGNFESGASSWNLSGAFHVGAFSYPHGGSYYSYLSNVDGTGGNNLNGTMYQSFSIPSNATNVILSYYWNVTSTEVGSTPYDILNITIQNSSGGYLATVAILDNTNKSSAGAYQQTSFSLSAYQGQNIRINFFGTTDATNPTVFRIDDVSVTATIAVTPPTAPSLTDAIGDSDKIMLQWTNVSNETGYKIQRSTSPSSGFAQVGTPLGVDVTACQDTSANAGTIYYYRVIAYNTGGDSPPSNVLGAVRLSPPAPSQPPNAATLTSTSVTLQWSSVTGAEGYGVYIGTTAGGTDVRNGEQVTPPSDSITLVNGTYYWRIRAMNATNHGLSSESTEWHFTVNVTAPHIRIEPTTLNITNP